MTALWQSSGLADWLQAYIDREPSLCDGCALNPAGMRPPTLDEAEQWLREGKLEAAEAGFAHRSPIRPRYTGWAWSGCNGVDSARGGAAAGGLHSAAAGAHWSQATALEVRLA